VVYTKYFIPYAQILNPKKFLASKDKDLNLCVLGKQFANEDEILECINHSIAI